MASKKYAYYNKGNKIALIQQKTTDVSSSDYGHYKSPQDTVVDGLEIEYTYAPIFNLQSTGTEGSDFHRFLGCGSDGTNLLLFTYAADAVTDLSSLFAADNWIYIEGSGRWSGLHQVKSAGSATGVLTLKTRCNLKPSKLSVTGTFATNETFNGDNAAADMDLEAFKDGQSHIETPYVFIDAAANANNAGLFSLSDDTTSGQLTFANKITIDADGDYTSTAAANTGGGPGTGDAVDLYNATYEQISVYEGVETLDDDAEAFELDLPRNQSLAVVYYLKAKASEDTGQFEEREYFMRLFYKQVEKFSSSRKHGPHIAQGHWNMK